MRISIDKGQISLIPGLSVEVKVKTKALEPFSKLGWL